MQPYDCKYNAIIWLRNREAIKNLKCCSMRNFFYINLIPCRVEIGTGHVVHAYRPLGNTQPGTCVAEGKVVGLSLLVLLQLDTKLIYIALAGNSQCVVSRW